MKRTEQQYRQAVLQAKSIAQVCRLLGLKPVGGNYATVNNAIKRYHIDTQHFTGKGWNIGLAFKPKQQAKIEDLLTEHSNYQSYKLRNRLLREDILPRQCCKCKRTTWQGIPIPLELHHINGDRHDNRIENLAMLCPNCHAMTDNYRGHNKSARRESDDVELP